MQEVRRLRQEKGWTQTQLAFYSGLAPSVISQIETGKRDPSAGTLRKLAEALGVEVADLFPKVAAPLPFEDTPSLEELPSLEEIHAEAGCATAWLIMSEEEWHAAWGQITSPRDAVFIFFDLADEYTAVMKRVHELHPDLALPHRLINGPYKQALLRWIYGTQNAHSCGVVARKIAVADTLDDLIKNEGLQEEMRKRLGNESLKDLMLAS